MLNTVAFMSPYRWPLLSREVKRRTAINRRRKNPPSKYRPAGNTGGYLYRNLSAHL